MVPAVVLIFNSRLALNSVLEITPFKVALTICQKVTKMGSIELGRGSERPAAHT